MGKHRGEMEQDLVLRGYAGQPEADIEDILGAALYVQLVNACHALKRKHVVGVPPAGGRIVKCLEEHFRTLPESVPEFDHYTPASYLVESTSDDLSGLTTRIQPELDKLIAAKMVARIGEEYEFLTGERRTFVDEVATVAAQLRQQDLEAGFSKHFVFDTEKKKNHLHSLLGFETVRRAAKTQIARELARSEVRGLVDSSDEDRTLDQLGLVQLRPAFFSALIAPRRCARPSSAQ